MATSADLPDTLSFGDLTMTRQSLRRYQVSFTASREPIASVEPDGEGSWAWLHYETEREGAASGLAEAAAVILAIESSPPT